nr:hypothetical protein [Planctomycetota bacterium]
MADRSTFTGRARQRRTNRSVRLSDRIATGLITVGGAGTIVAVSGVCLYLLWTVLPLFAPASLDEPNPTSQSPFASSPAVLRVSESNVIGWALDEGGDFIVFRPDTGEKLRSEPIADGGRQATTFAAGFGSDAVAIGFDDGTIRLGSVSFETSFIDVIDDDVKRYASLRSGEIATYAAGVVLRTSQDQLRRESVLVDFSAEPIEISPGHAVRRLDQVQTDGGPVLV